MYDPNSEAKYNDMTEAQAVSNLSAYNLYQFAESIKDIPSIFENGQSPGYGHETASYIPPTIGQKASLWGQVTGFFGNGGQLICSNGFSVLDSGPSMTGDNNYILDTPITDIIADGLGKGADIIDFDVRDMGDESPDNMAETMIVSFCQTLAYVGTAQPLREKAADVMRTEEDRFRVEPLEALILNVPIPAGGLGFKIATSAVRYIYKQIDPF